MKKNKMMRIASVLLVAVLLSTCAISGTFAKYTTTVTKVATVSVAKWDIDFDGDNDQSKDFEFGLFDTILDTNDAPDDEVEQGFIAPGTKGSFDIVLTNASDVDAHFTASFAMDPANAPQAFTFKYTINGQDYVPGESVDIARGNTVTVKVDWIWAFTDTDENEFAGDTFTVTATVVVEQEN